MHRLFPRALLALCAASACLAASATNLRIVPVLVDPGAGARTGVVTLTNQEQSPMRAQFRVMRWTRENGRDVLQPTEDVVVSPPQVTVAPGQDYVVRVVSVRAPAAGREDSYRLLVDELPDSVTPRRTGTVDLVLRQSIPVFFSDVRNRAANVDWNLVREGDNLWLVGRNSGARRLRIADLTFESGGRPVFVKPGLVGYVLAGSQAQWAVLPRTPLPPGANVRVKALTDTGDMEVSLVVPPAR